jgi:hypothetical protein
MNKSARKKDGVRPIQQINDEKDHQSHTPVLEDALGGRLTDAQAAALESRGSASEVKSTAELLNQEQSEAEKDRAKQSQDAARSHALGQIERTSTGEVDIGLHQPDSRFSDDGTPAPHKHGPAPVGAPRNEYGVWKDGRFIGNFASTPALCESIAAAFDRVSAEFVDPTFYTVSELASHSGYSVAQISAALDRVANKNTLTRTRGHKGRNDRQWVVDLYMADSILSHLDKMHAVKPAVAEQPAEQTPEEKPITPADLQSAYRRTAERCGGDESQAKQAVEDFGGAESLAGVPADVYPFVLLHLNRVAIRETARKLVGGPRDGELVALLEKYGVKKLSELELERQESFLAELDAIAAGKK